MEQTAYEQPQPVYIMPPPSVTNVDAIAKEMKQLQLQQASKQLSEMGVTFAAQLNQRVNDVSLTLHALMRSQFEKGFASRYAGVVEVEVEDINVFANAAHDLTITLQLNNHFERLHIDDVKLKNVRPKIKLPLHTAQHNMVLTLVVPPERGLGSVLGTCEVSSRMILDAAPVGLKSNWYTVNSVASENSREPKPVASICVSARFISATDFNVCDSVAFSTKVEHVFGNTLKLVTATMREMQTKIDTQVSNIADLEQNSNRMRNEIEELSRLQQQELAQENQHRDELIQTVARLLLEEYQLASPAVESQHLHLNVLHATFDEPDALQSLTQAAPLGYFVEVQLGNQNIKLATVASALIPTWNEEVTLTIPEESDSNTDLLCVTLHANTTSGHSKVIACNSFTRERYLSATQAITVVAKLFPPKTENGNDPDKDQPALCRLSFVLKGEKTRKEFVANEMTWKERTFLSLMLSALAATNNSDLAHSMSVTQGTQHVLAQLTQTLGSFSIVEVNNNNNNNSRLDEQSDLWADFHFASSFSASDASVLVTVGAMQRACRDMLSASRTQSYAPAHSVGAFASSIKKLVEAMEKVPDDKHHNVKLFAASKHPEHYHPWAADRLRAIREELELAYHVSVDCALAIKQSQLRRTALHQIHAPITGRLHVHLTDVKNIPAKHIKVAPFSVMFLLLMINGRTFQTSSVPLCDEHSIDCHLVFDVLDLATTEISITLCVEDSANTTEEPSDVEKEILAVGHGRVPVKEVLNHGSAPGEITLRQKTKSYAAFGRVGYELIFSNAASMLSRDPAKDTDADRELRAMTTDIPVEGYAAFGAQMTQNAAKKINVLEEFLAEAVADQTGVALKMKQLHEELQSVEAINQTYEQQLALLEQQLVSLRQPLV
eukprot:c10280_g1_i1.p1 GENE.c10280_g1_i1~~c10280_g1_i1.p1  ORF type:complete len:923 (+),score=289.35 c10280_g1_i1:91-2769(+)